MTKGQKVIANGKPGTFIRYSGDDTKCHVEIDGKDRKFSTRNVRKASCLPAISFHD